MPGRIRVRLGVGRLLLVLLRRLLLGLRLGAGRHVRLRPVLRHERHEFKNLTDDPKHAGTVKELKALVAKNWAEPYVPPGAKAKTEKKAAKKDKQ